MEAASEDLNRKPFEQFSGWLVEKCMKGIPVAKL